MRGVVDVLASTPETVAHAAFCGLRSGVAVIVPGVFWRAAWLGMSVVPAAILAASTRRALAALAPPASVDAHSQPQRAEPRRGDGAA